MMIQKEDRVVARILLAGAAVLAAMIVYPDSFAIFAISGAAVGFAVLIYLAFIAKVGKDDHEPL